jgi:hypothetical protein
MKRLTTKSKETLNKLVSKSQGTGRMPRLDNVSQLLNELGIENKLTKWSETKQTKASGLRYYTGGGTREYNGFQLKVPAINLTFESTETYYSWNNTSYARKIMNLINKHN